MSIKVLPANPVYGIGAYSVELDGQQIGHVRKRWDFQYARWDAYDLASADRPHFTPRIASGLGRRRDAVAALVDHYKRSLT